MNYFQKNKKNIIIGAISLLIIAILIALWLRSNSVSGSSDILATITPDRLKVGEQMLFEDKTPNAKKVSWDFGDGKSSTEKKGSHIYTNPNLYDVVLTVDGKYKKTFTVLVQHGQTYADGVIESAKISGPSQGMQLENLSFTAFPTNAKTYEWSFGETGRIDSNEKAPIYTYKKPGPYTITLTIDDENNNRQTISHPINIMKVYSQMDQAPIDAAAPPPVDDSYEKANDDIKKILQEIALGNNFNKNYNYLLSTYMCGNDNAAINVNNYTTSFYSYCMDLQHKENIVIQEVKTNYNSMKQCVVKLDITQSK